MPNGARVVRHPRSGVRSNEGFAGAVRPTPRCSTLAPRSRAHSARERKSEGRERLRREASLSTDGLAQTLIRRTIFVCKIPFTFDENCL